MYYKYVLDDTLLQKHFLLYEKRKYHMPSIVHPMSLTSLLVTILKFKILKFKIIIKNEENNKRFSNQTHPSPW